jgi:hypothetical protein
MNPYKHIDVTIKIMTGTTLQLHAGTRAKHRAGPKEAVE